MSESVWSSNPAIHLPAAVLERLAQDYCATTYGVHPGAVTFHCLHRRGEDAGVDYSAEVEILPVEPA